jgi:hypothetical protein
VLFSAPDESPIPVFTPFMGRILLLFGDFLLVTTFLSSLLLQFLPR